MDITAKNEGVGFIPNYRKVMAHLEREEFALPDFKINGNKICIKVPKRFSISERPDETIRVLRILYTIGKSGKIEKLQFDHSGCEFLGLSASALMDIIVLIMKQCNHDVGKKLDLRGRLPRKKQVRDVLLASGLPYHLNAEHKPKYDKTNVKRFEMRAGECCEEKRQSGKIATELTIYFNECLMKQGMKLKEEGILVLATLLGEMLDNCEIHGGSQATWYTQGHYENNPNRAYGELQLLFLNLGNTVYKGLRDTSSQETQARLEGFLDKHSSFFGESWNEEMAGTVLALQEGISRLRDRNIEGYEGRGTGTVSLIEALNSIGKRSDGLLPEMTIVSGRTYIKLDEKYKMHTEKFENDPVFGNGNKRIIAFNKDNNIYEPADASNVRWIKENFPGTVISLKLYLDNRYIEKQKESRQG